MSEYETRYQALESIYDEEPDSIPIEDIVHVVTDNRGKIYIVCMVQMYTFISKSEYSLTFTKLFSDYILLIFILI